MKRLALGVVTLLAVVGVFLPAADADACARRNGRLICGDSTTPVRINGSLELNQPIFPGDTTLGVVIDGGLTVVGSETVIGTIASGVSKPDVLDAGVARFNGTVQLTAPFNCANDGACGTVALSSGTPSTATKTVLAGSTCFCWPVGNTATIAAGGCSASVSSTTATFTGPNTVTTTVGWVCFK